MPAETQPKSSEQLKKMSFGDHLDELRRRLIICVITLFVCVGAMLPFKTAVTKVYMGPYNIMWDRAYRDFVADNQAEFEAGTGSKDPYARRAASLFLTPEKREEILAGGYPNPQEIAAQGGYEKPYPPKSDVAAWDAFAADFRDYAVSVRKQRDFLKIYIWHLERQDEIFAGDYDQRADLIYTDGGFPLHKNLKSTSPLQDFWTFMAAVLLFSFIIASPVVLYQLWAFIAAGLYKTERAVVYRALPFAFLLLAAGVTFGFTIMVPYGLYFLTQLMTWAQVGPLFTVATYFKFFLTLTFALGMVFQLPILMVALQKVGILKLATVAKNWRWVVLSFFVISAMLTPPDPVTQVLMVTPMLSLFALGLFLMWRAERKQKRAERASPQPIPSGGGT